MSPWWLLLIIPVSISAYCILGGFTYARLHHREGHDRRRCCVDDPPVCILGGVFWPVILPAFVIYWSVILGTRAEALRPARRKQRRDELTAKHEQEIYGKVLPR